MVKKEFNSLDKGKRYKYGIAPFNILLIGIITFGIQVFGYMEAELLNTYIDHVLNLEYIFIGIMVSFSATIGLIFLFVWGVVSDNTRSKFGRRKPFFFIGGLICGISIIVFGFSSSYLMVFVIDVLIIGIASNAYYSAQKVLVPDLVEKEYRGRVNGIVNMLGIFGYLLPLGLTFFANEFYTIPDPDIPGGYILTQEGHIILLSIGGVILLICTIIGGIFLKDNISQSELPEKRKFIEEIKRTFNIEELKKHNEFFKLLLAQTIIWSGVMVMTPYVFNFIMSIGLKTLDLALIFGIAGPISFISFPLLGKLADQIGRKKTLAIIILITTPGFAMIPFITEFSTRPNTILLGIAFSSVLIGVLALTIPMNTWAQDLMPEGRKGQFTGILNLRDTISQVIGSLSAGILATAISGIVIRPIAWIFLLIPFFFIGSIPLLMRVKETLTEN
ncbi:MAG: MFS transporter [Promethearchaeota archaeon]|jgi:GPH family glycoside/pentoside/hexuronide:cation symporter